jgi:hypothetical protein
MYKQNKLLRTERNQYRMTRKGAPWSDVSRSVMHVGFEELAAVLGAV